MRRLAAADAVAYRLLMLEGYEVAPDAFTASVAERGPLPLDWWLRRIDGNGVDAVFGACTGDALVGTAGVSFETRPKSAHKALLFGMYVPERWRRRGLARQLVGAVIDHARQRPGAVVVGLTLTDGNVAAQRLYERCGFAAWGIEPVAMRHGDGYAAKVHMARRLDA